MKQNDNLDHAPIVEAWLKETAWLPPSDTARLSQLVHQTPQQRRWWQRFTPGRTDSMFNALKFAAASVVLAVTGGFLFSTFLAPQDGQDVPPGAETTAPAPTSPAPTVEDATETAEVEPVVAPVDVTPADAVLRFDRGSGQTVGGYTEVGRIATKDRPGVTEMFDLQSVGGLLVARSALTTPDEQMQELILYSDDALSWAAAELPGEDLEIQDLVATDDGLLAAGSAVIDGSRQGRLWTSPDGVAWTEVSAPAVRRVHQVVLTDDANTLVRAGNQLWLDDGDDGSWRVWNKVNDMTFLSGPGGIVAYQGGGQDRQVPTMVLHWATPQSALSEVQLPEALDIGTISVDEVPAHMGIQAFALDDGWVMVGSELKAADEIHVSSDGLTWQDVPRPPEMSEGLVRWIADVDGSVHGLGIIPREDTSPTGLWSFTLGEAVGSPDTIGTSGDVWFDAPVAFDGGYVANGWDRGRDQALTLWMTSGADATLDTFETATEPAEATSQSADAAEEQDEAPEAATPRAPRATGDTDARFTVRDPNPRRGLVTWRDRADDEDGYRMYAKRVYCGLVEGADPNQALDTDDFTRLRSDFVRVGRVDADATEFRPNHQRIRERLPEIPGQQYGSGEIYELYAAAFNEAGESRRVLVGTYITTPEFMCP